MFEHLAFGGVAKEGLMVFHALTDSAYLVLTKLALPVPFFWVALNFRIWELN